MKSLKETIIENLEEILLETKICSKLYITVLSTDHADSREISRNIDEDELKYTVTRAIDKIDKAIQNNTLKIGSKFTIKDHTNNLNLPCIIDIDKKINKLFIRKNGNTQEYLLVKIITEFLGNKFNQYSSDYKIDLYE